MILFFFSLFNDNIARMLFRWFSSFNKLKTNHRHQVNNLHHLLWIRRRSDKQKEYCKQLFIGDWTHFPHKENSLDIEYLKFFLPQYQILLGMYILIERETIRIRVPVARFLTRILHASKAWTWLFVWTLSWWTCSNCISFYCSTQYEQCPDLMVQLCHLFIGRCFNGCKERRFFLELDAWSCVSDLIKISKQDSTVKINNLFIRKSEDENRTKLMRYSLKLWLWCCKQVWKWNVFRWNQRMTQNVWFFWFFGAFNSEIPFNCFIIWILFFNYRPCDTR